MSESPVHSSLFGRSFRKVWLNLVWILGHGRQLFWPILWFEVWFSILAAAAFFPLTAWVMDALVTADGGVAIGNTEMVAFFLSPRGLAFLLVATVSGLSIQYVEYAGLLVILDLFSRKPDAMEAGGTLEYLTCFPKLIRLGMIQVLISASLAGPWLAGCLLIKSHWLGSHDINYYLAATPREWYLALAVAVLWTLPWLTLGVMLFVRWLSAVPLIVFEDRTARDALAISWRRTRGTFLQWLLVLSGWILVVVIGFILSAGIIRWVTAWLLGANLGGLNWTLAVVLVALALIGASGMVTLVAGKVGLALLVQAEYLALKPPELTQVERPTTAWLERLRVRGTRVAVWALVLVFLGSGVLWIWQKLDEIVPAEVPKITAHRGSSRTAPENTLSALRQAIEDGAEYAEIDVQTTADGMVVLQHDADFMRIAGDPGKLEDMTLEEVRALDVGRLFSSEFTGERLATLEEAIEVCRGRLLLNIELKYNRPDPELATRVGEILRREAFTDQCIVMSLDWGPLSSFRKAYPEVPIGLIVFRSLGRIESVNADAYSLNAARISMSRVHALQRMGAEVHVWTVNDPRLALNMIETGVDNLITDVPADLRALITDWQNLSDSEKTVLQLRRLLLPKEQLPAAEL